MIRLGVAFSLIATGGQLLSAQRPVAAGAGSVGVDGPGVSVELARDRAETIRGVRYGLTLDVTSTDSAEGRVRVSFQRSGSGDVILDFRGRRLLTVAVNGLPIQQPVHNGHHLRIAAKDLRRGENAVEATFVSDIAPSGASIIRTRDASDGRDYLYTLLVPADASQLFPCFDQPDLKARVSLTLIGPKAWVVVANGSVTSADTVGDRVTTRFMETAPLSTYLVAFAAGPWIRSTSAVDGRSISLYTRRSRAREVDGDTLLALTHRALGWMEGYFGRSYPFEKFDIMLSPAFPFGGMEHPGLVMFNEDRFIFRDRPTLARRLSRFSTILHEVAHQWFGDFVTMRWFDDLWLKEGFATYMGAKALAELEPSADAWKMFFQANKPAAYSVDETPGTTSLWQELGNLNQAKSAYGAIVYNKAPGVLKQLNHLVGDTAFQGGVRQFLATHAYGNATWRDLLDAIGSASGNDLSAFGQNFMLRPGMPIVEPVVDVRGGRIARLALVQQAAQPSVSGTQPWPMRTRVLLSYPNGSLDRFDVTLTGATTVVDAAAGRPAPRFVFPNAGDFGYFISLLDTASVSALEAGALAVVPDPLLRSMLWGALWDQVRAMRLPPDRFARLLLRELPRESDEQILPSLISRLDRTLRAYLVGPEVTTTFRAAENVLWAMHADPTRTFGVRRASLDGFLSVASTDSGRAWLVRLFGSDSAAGEPLRDPTRWAIVDRLLVLDDPRGESLLAAQVARDTTPDGRRRTFTAGAARPTARTKSDYFARYFADRELNEDWATGSLGQFNALEHQKLTLPLLHPALDSLPFIQQHRRIFFLGSWLGSFLGGQTSSAAAGVVKDWLAAHPALPPDLRQKVLQNFHELDRAARIRTANTPPNR